MRWPALVLLSVFFPSFDLLLYYNTQAALETTTRAPTRTGAPTHPRGVHMACTWWAHQAVAPLVAPGENELAT